LSLHSAVREGNDALGTQLKRTGENLAAEVRHVSGDAAVEVTKSVAPILSDLGDKLKTNSLITWVLVAISIATSAYTLFAG
jgi:hypothetical protein